MRIGLMAPAFIENDAIGSDLFGTYIALQRAGYQVFAFSPDGSGRPGVPTYSYADVPVLLGRDDLLVYHYCLADLAAMTLMRQLDCRIVIRYHNVTPAIYMYPYSVDFARTCRLGRELLVDVADMRIEAFLCDSDYNAREFLRLGVDQRRIFVVPPLHQIASLFWRSDDADAVRMLQPAAFNVVAVGRIVPNKGWSLMLESFADAVEAGLHGVNLQIAGAIDPRFQRYHDELTGIIDGRGIRDFVHLRGSVNAAALGTLYRHANLFWTTSFHEGFCVPVVEAMAFGMPILSSRETALPETCGDAAEYATGREEFAARLLDLVHSDERRRLLAKSGRQRYEARFRADRLDDAILAAISSILALRDERGSRPSVSPEDDWFGLPDAPAFVAQALAALPDQESDAFRSRARRLDFVDLVLREGWRGSRAVRDYLRSPAFERFAAAIEVPDPASDLTPLMRLAWTFHRLVGVRYDLRSESSVLGFRRWFDREGVTLYGFGRDDAGGVSGDGEAVPSPDTPQIAVPV